MKPLEPGTAAERRTLLAGSALAIALLAVDQLTKLLVVRNIPMYHRIPVIDGFFDLTHITNTGAAWGVFSGRGGLLMLISLVVFALMIGFLRSLCGGWRERYYALLLVLSGIAGNLLDRVFRSAVVDFLHFHYRSFEYPSFNVADSCICVGVGLFILSNLIRPDGRPEAGAAEPGQKAAEHDRSTGAPDRP